MADWLSDPWLQSLGDRDGQPQPYSIHPISSPMKLTDNGTAQQLRSPLPTGWTPESGSSALRYPVLEPLVPYITRILSPSLTCGLLESYVADVADGVFVPSSPLLLTHIFRRASLLSSRPRQCTPALLASMLLVSAHTTEYPFFGSSPSARMKLYQQLLQLTLDLLEGDARYNELHRRRAQALNTRLYRSSVNGVLHPDACNGPTPVRFRRGKTAYVDDVVTYMHIALVTTTAESKPAGFRWWHTAFQLAREFRLNRDVATSMSSPQNISSTQQGQDGTMSVPAGEENLSSETDGNLSSGAASPMSVSDDAIVEHSDPRPLTASIEEREERRRVWWTLYTWDRQLALRYNSPLAIKDAESKDLPVPMPDEMWQSSGDFTSNDIQSAAGPPATCARAGVFEVLLPLMCILGQVIDLHHLAYHPRVESGSSNSVANAYVATITQQLLELEPSITALESHDELSFESHHAGRHRRLLACYARFLSHTLFALLNGQWDKLTILEYGDAYFTSPSFYDALNHSVAAAQSLKQTMLLDPELGFKAMFFGIFTFHAATLPWAAATKFKQNATEQVKDACETYIRVFEASNCTYHAEYMVS